MTDLVMVEASLFHLRTALASLEDEMLLPQLELTTSVLANAIAAARETFNAARVSDIEFALNDVAGVVDSLSAADAARLEPIVAMLRDDVEGLKGATALPEGLVGAMREFCAKLRARKSAIERQTFVEGAAGDLPHPPQELAPAARALRERLADAGFATPAIDAFLDDPSELRLHRIIEMVDELEVIA